MQRRALLRCLAVWQPSRPTRGALCPAAGQAHTIAAPLTAGNFNFGGGNPMRPHRVRLTHSLVDNYQLTKELLVHRPNMRTAGELQMFHADGEKLGPQPGCTGAHARWAGRFEVCLPEARFSSCRHRRQHLSGMHRVGRLQSLA